MSYSCKDIEKLMNHYSKEGGDITTIEEGVLGYGTVVLSAPDLKYCIIQEVATTCWTSTHKIIIIQIEQQTLTPQQIEELAIRKVQVLMARAREKAVWDIIQPEKEAIVQRGHYTTEEGVKIECEKDMYLCVEDTLQFTHYLSECKRMYKRVGLPPEREGCCPLLEAQAKVREMEWELIKRWCEFIGLDTNLLPPIKERREFLRIVMEENEKF